MSIFFIFTHLSVLCERYRSNHAVLLYISAGQESVPGVIQLCVTHSVLYQNSWTLRQASTLYDSMTLVFWGTHSAADIFVGQVLSSSQVNLGPYSDEIPSHMLCKETK